MKVSIFICMLLLMVCSQANAQTTIDERRALFVKCYDNPTADAKKYGHGGNCYAHCRPGECDDLGFSIKTNLFWNCRKNPGADAAKYGHGGECCAHLTEAEGDFVNQINGSRLCNKGNAGISLDDLRKMYNVGCSVALVCGYVCAPLP